VPPFDDPGVTAGHEPALAGNLDEGYATGERALDLQILASLVESWPTVD